MLAASSIEKSKQLNNEVFSLEVICDFGVNVILKERLR